jgi:hypothetical protein
MSAGVLVGVAGCGRLGYDPRATCAGDLCEADAGGPPGTADAGPPGSETGCGSLQLLQESFDGATTEQYWYSLFSGGGQAVLAHDRVELKLGAGSGAAEASFTANSSYDARHSEITVEVLRVGGRSSGLELRDGAGRDRFTDFIGASRGVAVAVENGQLVALALDGDNPTLLASVRYDAAAQRFWRLRELDGEMRWETSPDRSTWSTWHAEAVAMDASLVYPVLFARGQVASASEAWFDNLNVPTSRVRGFCAASTLRDDFAASTLAPVWRPWNGAGACTVSDRGGMAEMAFPGDFSACSLVSVPMFDLRESAFALNLASLPGDASFQTLIELRTARAGDRVEVRVRGASVTLRVYADDQVASESSSTLAPARHFVRLRESGAQLSWDTSADGVTWTTPMHAPTTIDVSAVNLAVTGLHNGTGSGSAQVLRVDSVNLP